MHKDHIHFDGLADWGQIVSVWMKEPAKPAMFTLMEPDDTDDDSVRPPVPPSLVEAMSIRRRPTIVHCKGNIRTLAFMELVRLADLVYADPNTTFHASKQQSGKNSSKADVVDSNWHNLAMAVPLGCEEAARLGWLTVLREGESLPLARLRSVGPRLAELCVRWCPAKSFDHALVAMGSLGAHDRSARDEKITELAVTRRPGAAGLV